ncbi:hypothetical protein JAK73_00385 [Stenotrophomonas maltophilia]|nr:hypothetical protein [Stenotrophomonas maltophilia]
MPEITLKREDSLKVLNDPSATADARVIAACAMAIFECNDDELTEQSTRQIAHKILRMAGAALDNAAEVAADEEDDSNG